MSTIFIQRLLYDWVRRCFGVEVNHNLHERGLRLVEEVLELCQTSTPSITPELLHKLVDEVYSRPKGEIEQEFGGVMVCTYVMATALGINPNESLEREVRRLMDLPPEKFTKRNEEKHAKGF